MSTKTKRSNACVPQGEAIALKAWPPQVKPGFTSKKQPQGFPAREQAGRLAVITGYQAPAIKSRASTA